MTIQRCGPDRRQDWARLRRALWPDSRDEDFVREDRDLGHSDARTVVFLALDDHDRAIGFALARVRTDPVNGCDTSPVAFLEGILVEEAHRRRAVGRRLCEAVETWGRSMDCSEFGSDALIDNLASHAFHAAMGFDERERVVAFAKRL